MRQNLFMSFINKKINHSPILVSYQIIPHSNLANCLDMILGAKVRWKEHDKKKREQLGIKFKKILWLLGRLSELSLLVITQTSFETSVGLWCATLGLHKEIRHHNTVLRGIVDAAWYVRNDVIQRDLKIPMVIDDIKRFSGKYE